MAWEFPILQKADEDKSKGNASLALDLELGCSGAMKLLFARFYSPRTQLNDFFFVSWWFYLFLSNFIIFWVFVIFSVILSLSQWFVIFSVTSSLSLIFPFLSDFDFSVILSFSLWFRHYLWFHQILVAREYFVISPSFQWLLENLVCSVCPLNVIWGRANLGTINLHWPIYFTRKISTLK